MLSSLSVRHFAVVEEVEVEFGPGLTVVTGETGAGKSLLVDALLLLSGTRADASVIRADAERAELSAEFDLSGLDDARQWLADAEMDDGDTCQLRRVLRANGRSRAWINGTPATLTQLAALTPLMLEIHGQQEHQALLSQQHQLALLDGFAANAETRDRVRDCARHWREIGERLQALSGGDDHQQRMDLLRHELDQLQQSVVSPDALAELENEHKRLANAERLVEGCRNLMELIDGDSDQSLQQRLSWAHGELDKLAEVDSTLQSARDMLGTANIQLGEAGTALTHYADMLELDPARFQEVDAHLSRLHDLARRHNVAPADLEATAQSLQTQLDELENAGARVEELHAERQRLVSEYTAAAADLSASRQQAAGTLGQRVTDLMQELGMNGGRFTVELQTQEAAEPSAQGTERCEFHVSANAGQPPGALRKVASGGELARISLAIEVAALGADSVASMVFDEVDAGIGGAIAEIVGQKLRALGEQRQILCVTHLPQVAAQGHTHLRVEKAQQDTQTTTTLASLDTQARCGELARMLGGVDLTDETLAHARKMLEMAQR